MYNCKSHLCVCISIHCNIFFPTVFVPGCTDLQDYFLRFTENCPRSPEIDNFDIAQATTEVLLNLFKQDAAFTTKICK